MENLFVKKNPLQDLHSSLNSVISTNKRNEILTDHLIFKAPKGNPEEDPKGDPKGIQKGIHEGI